MDSDSKNSKNIIDKLSREARKVELMQQGYELSEQGKEIAHKIEQLMLDYDNIIEKIKLIKEELLQLSAETPLSD